MTDETDRTPSVPEPSAPLETPAVPSGPSALEAWEEVVTRMSDLGDAVARWARAATNDPTARQKLAQIRGGINDIGQKADAAFGQVANSEFTQQVKDGAEQAGQAISDAAQQVSQAAAPHMKNAFAGLSDVFGKAAAKMDEAARRHAETAAPVDAETPAEPVMGIDPVAPGEPVVQTAPSQPVERTASAPLTPPTPPASSDE